MNIRPYPKNLVFKTVYHQQFATQLLPYAQAFFEGEILDDRTPEWNNVFAHCLSESISIDIVVEAVNEAFAEQEQELWNREHMVVTAFLHDSYKRREERLVKQNREDPFAIFKSDEQEYGWVTDLGYPPEVVWFIEAFGAEATKKIHNGSIVDLPRRLLHYIDNITYEDQVVSLEKRISLTERKAKYASLNEAARTLFDGQTFYDTERAINRSSEQEVAQLLGLLTSGNLPQWINGRLNQRIAILQV